MQAKNVPNSLSLEFVLSVRCFDRVRYLTAEGFVVQLVRIRLTSFARSFTPSSILRLCLDPFKCSPWPTFSLAECNCNNHATSCTFNSYVYEASGNVSGGVCEACMHNTEGKNCDSCIIGFYQDPNLDITHPEVCKRELRDDADLVRVISGPKRY